MHRLTLLRLLSAAALLLLVLAATAALAHEFWLEVPGYRVAAGSTHRLHRFSGENFAGEKWTGKARRVVRLVRFGPLPADSTDLTPQQPGPTDSLAGSIRFERAGTHLVALHTNAAYLQLPADKFTAYLKEEGLTDALTLRHVRGQDTAAGREAYRRCAKTLVQVGPAAGSAAAAPADTAYRRVLGAPLELVPEQNPYRRPAGASLTVRVLRAGQPAAGAQVQLWQRQPAGQATRHSVLRTNKNGRLLLRLSGPGPYLLGCVEMVPMPRPTPAGLPAAADWLSTWASLTFAGPAAPPGGRR